MEILFIFNKRSEEGAGPDLARDRSFEILYSSGTCRLSRVMIYMFLRFEFIKTH